MDNGKVGKLVYVYPYGYVYGVSGPVRPHVQR
jgi:hypothetical protein